eukprot:Amastigsp_a842021_47.p7 type:complete len:111 gc:universal Amastigsp_a842021_47:1636-1304(-)
MRSLQPLQTSGVTLCSDFRSRAGSVGTSPASTKALPTGAASLLASTSRRCSRAQPTEPFSFAIRETLPFASLRHSAAKPQRSPRLRAARSSGDSTAPSLSHCRATSAASS